MDKPRVFNLETKLTNSSMSFQLTNMFGPILFSFGGTCHFGGEFLSWKWDEQSVSMSIVIKTIIRDTIHQSTPSSAEWIAFVVSITRSPFSLYSDLRMVMTK